MEHIIIFIALLLAMSAKAENLCPSVDNQVEPEFRWVQDDFSKESAEKSFNLLSGVLLDNKKYERVSLPNPQTIISGYIHKREALAAIEENSSLKEYYVSKFCTFISSHGRVNYLYKHIMFATAWRGN